MPARLPGVYGLPPGQRRPDRFAYRVIASAPIGYWRMAEASDAAVAVDEMGNYHGSYSVASGVPGQPPIRPNSLATSMSVVDTRAGVQTPVMPALTNWTFGIWTKVYTSGPYSFLYTLGTTGGQLIRVGTGNGLVSYSEGTGWSYGSTVMPVGSVAFLVVTWDGATSRVYKNGLYAENGARIGRTTQNAAWAFPAGSSGGAQLSDAIAWSRTLGASEIQALYLAAAG